MERTSEQTNKQPIVQYAACSLYQDDSTMGVVQGKWRTQVAIA
jgi:hypothetical protein